MFQKKGGRVIQTAVLLPPPACARCSRLTISDAPAYRHRGVMLDTGRRHFPVPLVKSIVDGMAAAKLNVLHLHLSDFGGYRVQLGC